jgi:bacteriophage N4 adsorption protein B
MLLFTLALGLVLVTGFLLHCDDLFLDAYNFWKRIKPRPLAVRELQQLRQQPQKRFAILIPHWKEAAVLEAMVTENLSQLEYENFSLFLGVYPNDPASWAAARRLERRYPSLSVIVSEEPGPTSKAKLLNRMARAILQSEEATGVRHEAFVIHDTEDVIHPLSLAVLNREMENADLVQLPVLASPLPWKRFAAGTYADETAESHMRDLPARCALGARLPGTGAGMALSRTLLKTLLSQGSLLNEQSATENYHLGLQAGRLGFRSKIVSTYLPKTRDFIATRKVFPENTEGAIRQKARWTTGIAFQGAARFGWRGSLAERYFLWRDRRGPWTTLLLAVASFLFLLSAFQAEGEPPILPRWLELLSLINAGLWLRRVAWRMRTTAWVYGWAYALGVPLRWPVANFINSISTWRAVSLYGKTLRTGNAPSWMERSRRLPDGFGGGSLKA